MADTTKKLDFMFGISSEMPRIIEIELTKPRPNPDQPRKVFNEETIKELASSIEQHGLIQPISVIPVPESDNFVIVAGERRYRAHQELGKPTITAIITKGNSDEIALIENIQREDLSPVDQAEGLASMMEKHGYKQEDLARVVGKSRPTVTELLSLNALPEDIKQECRTFDVPKSYLVQIVRAPAEQRHQFWESYKKGEVKTVREAKKRKAGEDTTTTQQPPKKAKRVFETTQKTTVIVQGQPRGLPDRRPYLLFEKHSSRQREERRRSSPRSPRNRHVERST